MKKEIIASVIQDGRFLKAVTLDGQDVSSQIDRSLRRQAAEQGLGVIFDPHSNTWGLYRGNIGIPAQMATLDVNVLTESVGSGSEHQSIVDYIKASVQLKPKDLFISDINWKFLVRSALRGKNIMLTGPSGCGKTKAARTLVKALNRPDFYFNLGSTQDPRITLIGTTQFDPANGTFFAESEFITAIQTKDAVILIDEISRAHPEAWNILMTVFDPEQRYLRIDERPGSPVIKVAEGVSFIATANIGAEYTASRQMDRALVDRFIISEMQLLDLAQELALLKLQYPKAPANVLNAIAEIACATRVEAQSMNAKLSNMISTRVSLEAAGLAYDEFTLHEIAEVAFYPLFEAAGGAESERTYVKQLVQKYNVSVAGTRNNNIFGRSDMVRTLAPNGIKI